MNSRMLVSLALASFSLIFSAGCSTREAKKKSPQVAQEDETTAPVVVGTHYTTLVFDKGKTTLNESNKKYLREFALRAHNNNKSIEDIKILAWADKEYPDKTKSKAGIRDIILASERAQTIKQFLEEDLNEGEDIDSFNMAKRPNLFARIIKNTDYNVKDAFEKSGATAARLPNGSVSYTKASKALVIIDYQGDENNSK